ncbi:unnamed protein product [Fraxinus pennsylvanica]|uniref:Uncharacterized protein n=1 Tax=Fraxinus pennsylvanica TaxID=56036 RepID=A0AAD2A438_9LAMI|nr:unnamed protein product [Fraxinus pennsylvanica]
MKLPSVHLGVEEIGTVNYEIANLIHWRKHFGNVVLIMFYNGPVERTALEWRLLYGRIFKTVIIFPRQRNVDLAVEEGQLDHAYNYLPKLFDRYNGFSSVIEAIVNDRRLVMLPQKGDQFVNSKLVHGDHKAGVKAYQVARKIVEIFSVLDESESRRKAKRRVNRKKKKKKASKWAGETAENGTIEDEVGLIHWRKHFENVVLIMFCSGPVERTALEWRLLYGRIFKTVIILPGQRNIDLAVEEGQLDHAYNYLPKLFDRYNGVDGFLFLQDDTILNYWNLLQGDKTKL